MRLATSMTESQIAGVITWPNRVFRQGIPHALQRLERCRTGWHPSWTRTKPLWPSPSPCT